MKETQEVTDRDMEIVSRIRARLVAQFGEERFELWFGARTRLEWSDGSLQISADTAFRADRLRRSLSQEIRRVLLDEMGQETDLRFCVDTALSDVDTALSDTASASSPLAAAVTSSGAQQGVLSLLKPSEDSAERRTTSWSSRSKRGRRFASLDTLVVGSCNRIAVGAAELVVGEPGQMNPLYIHGPSGAGKTHLLEGIWTNVRRRGGRRIIYLTAEQFTTYFLQALRGSGLPSFRQKYRAVDLLILDDVQFFAGKNATITELLHTLDALLCESRQIVMAADRSPGELAPLGAELQARISGGLVGAVLPLDVDTRRTLLGQIAQRRKLVLGNDLLNHIAERAPGDARQLIGVVNRLWATGQTLHQDLSRAMIDDVLDELFPRSGGVIKLDDIQRVVCDEFGLNPSDLRSDRRARRVSHPRMLAMWLARKHTHAALTEIGDFFGRRSHSTVLSAQNKVEGWVHSGQKVTCDRSNGDVRSLVSRLERSLRA